MRRARGICTICAYTTVVFGYKQGKWKPDIGKNSHVKGSLIPLRRNDRKHGRRSDHPRDHPKAAVVRKDHILTTTQHTHIDHSPEERLAIRVLTARMPSPEALSHHHASRIRLRELALHLRRIRAEEPLHFVLANPSRSAIRFGERHEPIQRRHSQEPVRVAEVRSSRTHSDLEADDVTAPRLLQCGVDQTLELGLGAEEGAHHRHERELRVEGPAQSLGSFNGGEVVLGGLERRYQAIALEERVVPWGGEERVGVVVVGGDDEIRIWHQRCQRVVAQGREGGGAAGPPDLPSRVGGVLRLVYGSLERDETHIRSKKRSWLGEHQRHCRTATSSLRVIALP